MKFELYDLMLPEPHIPSQSDQLEDTKFNKIACKITHTNTE